MSDTSTISDTRAGSETMDFRITWGMHGLLMLLTRYNDRFSTVLDIGSGDGEHARFLRLFGKKVFAVDLHREADYVGDFGAIDFDRKFDLVWCSHALEHQRNVGRFLEKIYSVLADDGLLAIAVPTHSRDNFVDGHVTTWNAGLLLYNLVLAGFDCKHAIFMENYDLCLIVPKQPAHGGDVKAVAAHRPVKDLAAYFPYNPATGVAAVNECNWSTNYSLPRVGRPVRLRILNTARGTIETDVT